MNLEQALKKVEELQMLNKKLQKRVENLERVMYDEVNEGSFDNDYTDFEFND